MDNYPDMDSREYAENIAGVDYAEIEERKLVALDIRRQEKKEENLDKGF